MSNKPKIAANIRNSLTELAKTRAPWNLLRLLTPRIYRFTDLIITNSSGGADEFITGGIDRSKVRVIYNGYDSDRIRTLSAEPVVHPWFVEHTVPIVVATGRLSRQKNYPLLLAAFRILLNTHDCRLVIIGAGPEESNLHRLTADAGMERNVDFIGNQENPYRYISKADIFALSSSWEGFPNVLCEAMICGTPVVATDCPTGPNEIISDGLNGCLVPADDCNAFARALAGLLDDATMRRRLVDNATESVKSFSIERMVAAYNDCYAELAGKN